MEWTRRQLLLGFGLGALSTDRARAAAPDGRAGQGEKPGTKARLDLTEFQPRSMLHVHETRVERSRFPVIDVHTHLGWAARERGGVARGEEMTFLAPPDAALKVMDSKNLRMIVNLTGGYGKGLERPAL
jgi:hypothetical protein